MVVHFQQNVLHNVPIISKHVRGKELYQNTHQSLLGILVYPTIPEMLLSYYLLFSPLMSYESRPKMHQLLHQLLRNLYIELKKY